MNTQPEQILENNLIKQLVGIGYKAVKIDDEADLLINFKRQLEIHNKLALSDQEFSQVLN